jgi:23S rRNA (uracil1939-C5)-methyltransferase
MQNHTLPISVTLTTLTYGGETMGRLEDGRAVFVPFTFPGERVLIRLVEEKRSFARAELLEVLEASPLRILPRCKHFGTCGGCHYQHMAYIEQLQAKQTILCDQLKRIAGLTNIPILPVVPSPRQFNYRNHVQFHLDAQGKLGYYTANSEFVFPIQECHLPELVLNPVWQSLDFEAIAELERIGLRCGVGEDIQLILESYDLKPPELKIEDLPISVAHLSQAGCLVLAGSAGVVMQVKERFFHVSAGSFFQVNTDMAGALVDGLVSGLVKFTSLDHNSTILDVYCGVGLFSAFLAGQVGSVVGIEVSDSAVEDFTDNLDEFDNVEIYQASVEEVLPNLKIKQPEVAIVDPPRAGLERKALDALLALQPELIAYISCDPATLARDARRLMTGGYELLEITLYDLFPQTYHIESLSFWKK